MPKRNPEYLFSKQNSSYYDTPVGCLRLVRFEGDDLVGELFGRRHRVPRSQVEAVVRRSWLEGQR
jgi:hypothetical protein